MASLDGLRFIHEPGAAGSKPGLKRCEKRADGYVCRWARARISPSRMVELGRDLQSIVDGREPKVELRWGTALSRTYRLNQLAELPLESLREACRVTITAEQTRSGWHAEVSFDATQEPALTAIVRGPVDVTQEMKDDVAQKVKDAVEHGNWNPISGNLLSGFFAFLVFYTPALLVQTNVIKVSMHVGNMLLVLTVALLLAIPILKKRLYPPIEIHAGQRTTIASVIRSAVPVLAAAAGVVATALKIFGIAG